MTEYKPISAENLTAQVQSKVDEDLMPLIWKLIYDNAEKIVNTSVSIDDKELLRKLNQHSIDYVKRTLASYGYEFSYYNDQREGKFIQIKIK